LDSSGGSRLNNAHTESFFGTFKQETGIGKWYLEDLLEVEAALFDWIDAWYNPKRWHSYLDYYSPVEFENKMAA
jgi:putative transposase